MSHRCSFFALAQILLFGYFTAIVLFMFVLDLWFRYPMCELCLLQRLWMMLLAVLFGHGFISAAWFSLPWHRLRVFLQSSALLLGLLSAFAQYRLYLAAQSSFSCSLSAGPTYMPATLYALLANVYQFVPCAVVELRFLGLSFPVWEILVYTSALLFYGGILLLSPAKLMSLQRSFYKVLRLSQRADISLVTDKSSR